MSSVSPSERHRYLDLLRGFALLGILPANIPAFALPAMAEESPAAVSRGALHEYVAWYATRLISRIFFESFEAKHDGPLSVLRAYTPREVAELARMAGLPGAEVHTRPPFRMCLIARA